jgi:ABC-type multidrug transport system ATPase subunit
VDDDRPAVMVRGEAELVARNECRLDRVSKRYRRRGRAVLDGIDVTVAGGELAVVIGGNGSGKSTLGRVLAGLSRPTTGTVRRPARVAYVPERAPAAVRLSAHAYLNHLGQIRGLPPADASRRAREVLERLAVAPGPDTEVSTMSKGNRQKVALAQAFLVPVGLLVLDEPYSGLDPPAATALDVLVAEALDHGTVVVKTGHTADACAGATASYRLEGGVLVRLDPGVAVASGARSARRRSSDDAVRVRLGLPAGTDQRWLEAWGTVVVGERHVELAVPPDDVNPLLAAAIAHGYPVLDVRARRR